VRSHFNSKKDSDIIMWPVNSTSAGFVKHVAVKIG